MLKASTEQSIFCKATMSNNARSNLMASWETHAWPFVILVNLVRSQNKRQVAVLLAITKVEAAKFGGTWDVVRHIARPSQRSECDQRHRRVLTHSPAAFRQVLLE